MNLERIAEEVTKELLSEIYLNQAASAPNIPYSRILLVCGKTDLNLEPILTKLSKWKEKALFTIVAPKWAQNLWGAGRFESIGLEVDYLAFDSAGEKAKTLVGQVDRIAVLGLTPTLANKMSHANQENLVSAVAVEALGRNKPFMVLDENAHGFSQSAKLQAMGVRLGTLNDLEHVFPLPPQPSFKVSNPVQTAQPQTGHMPASCHGCDLHGQCATLCSDRVRQMVEAGAQRVGASLGIHPVPNDLAKYIDHTLLKADSTEAQVRTLCAEAKQYGFASVCVNPTWVSLCADLLKGTSVMVCTVIGFPLGATDSQTKAQETRFAIQNGADEIDMVINVGALKSGQHQKVESDIRGVVQAAGGKTVKVILETALLNDAEKTLACQLSEKAGAHFVKTSTGFGPSGATEQDIALMRRTVKPEMEVKASGGIRNQETALKMVRAGATRIGASASIAIVKGEDAGAGKY